MPQDPYLRPHMAPELLNGRVILYRIDMGALGVHEALFVQQLAYKLGKAYENYQRRVAQAAAGLPPIPQYGRVDSQGRAWVYVTVREWKEDFGNTKEFDDNRVRRVFKRLEELGIVLTHIEKNTTKYPGGQVKWYSLDGKRLHEWLVEHQPEPYVGPDADNPIDLTEDWSEDAPTPASAGDASLEGDTLPTDRSTPFQRTGALQRLLLQ